MMRHVQVVFSSGTYAEIVPVNDAAFADRSQQRHPHGDGEGQHVRVIFSSGTYTATLTVTDSTAIADKGQEIRAVGLVCSWLNTRISSKRLKNIARLHLAPSFVRPS